jgi:steroid 5-alpha reductase family enzyme
MSFGLLSVYAVSTMLLAVWVVSIIRRDAGIIDIFWGLGFGLIAFLAALRFPDAKLEIQLIYLLVILWALRLAIHLARRWLREAEEDKRYQSMRRRAGPLFWLKSLFTVFGLQGLLILLIAQPLIHLTRFANISFVAPIFYLFWAIAFAGVAIETIADRQLTAFRAAATGGILQSGLWARSRHPNYFGDALFWWGITAAIIAIAPELIWTLIAPLTMNILLVKISGAELLEKYMQKRDGYAAYQARTNRFIPRFFS